MQSSGKTSRNSRHRGRRRTGLGTVGGAIRGARQDARPRNRRNRGLFPVGWGSRVRRWKCLSVQLRLDPIFDLKTILVGEAAKSNAGALFCIRIPNQFRGRYKSVVEARKPETEGRKRQFRKRFAEAMAMPDSLTSRITPPFPAPSFT